MMLYLSCHRHILMCTQRMMSSTTPSILLLMLNSLSLASTQSNWDDLHVDLSKIFDQATEGTQPIGDQSWKLSNGQIFVILITFFIVVFLVILCCAGRRKRKAPETATPPIPQQAPSLCHSCQSTIHSVSQLGVSEDPYPPTYDSIYSTAQSRAMFLQHDQNRRRSGPQPSAPPASDFP